MAGSTLHRRGTLPTIVIPIPPNRPGNPAPSAPVGQPQNRNALAVFCADPKLLAQVRGALPVSMDVLTVSEWAAFERIAPAAACSVVVAPWLERGGIIAPLGALKARLPLRPLVLVTEKDADNVRLLKDLTVEELVWIHELDRDLWAAIGRARAASLLRQMASAFEQADHLSPKLRTALAHAFRSNTPIRSVTQLAAAVGYDRRTLWRYWRDAFSPKPPLQPSDFVDWLLLLRAAGLKVPGRKWVAVASELGIHEHTIARIARRLTGLTLRDIAAGGQGFVARLFAHEVLGPLLTTAA